VKNLDVFTVLIFLASIMVGI